MASSSPDAVSLDADYQDLLQTLSEGSVRRRFDP
ncbi:Uncharacterised protein [Mycolicibacterium fortuitum]|nr:Uncharacterised protein [Mycolicibacterium fortuitum]